MEIERINTYADPRFPGEVLLEHGAFLIDGRPCGFKIRDGNSATVFFDGPQDLTPAMDAFRYYAEHITVFYKENGEKLAEYPPVDIRTMPLEDIQPSQFFVDGDKLRTVASFIRSGDDIVVPVIFDRRTGRTVSLDGHTRLYYAYTQGFEKIRVFEMRTDDTILDFVDEARRRGVFCVRDMKALPHGDYVREWDGFCDQYWQKIQQGGG